MANGGVIYPTRERAEWWANELNKRPGHPVARAVETENGWTVIADYKYGITRA